jgi:transposase
MAQAQIRPRQLISRASRASLRKPVSSGTGLIDLARRCGDLVVPGNIMLLYLPPYSPELNPKENLWDEIREKILKNYALKSIAAVRSKLQQRDRGQHLDRHCTGRSLPGSPTSAR